MGLAGSGAHWKSDNRLCVGDRSTKTFRDFYQKFEHLDAKFYSDDWESYAKVIPAEKLSTGKSILLALSKITHIYVIF